MEKWLETRKRLTTKHQEQLKKKLQPKIGMRPLLRSVNNFPLLIIIIISDLSIIVLGRCETSVIPTSKFLLTLRHVFSWVVNITNYIDV